MRGQTLIKALLFAGPFLLGNPVMAEAVPVELQKTESGWELLRGGEPYFIRGAGGTHSLAALAAAGANSLRTWGADDLEPLLDEAHALGLTVTVGIWLGHERHGFDYDDPAQVEAQLERAREAVLRYRDHPAVLLWGIGNETEGFGQGDDPRIWQAVNDVAALVKTLDPDHPTMVVTTFVHGKRIEYVHNRSPAIDIHGVNAYAGALAVPDLLREAGARKPFVLTEFGPPGPWEVAKTPWGAPLEPTSREKAAHYGKTYEQAVIGSPGHALGSYAFLWGHKMEATATWFGMFLEDGAPTAAVDSMSRLWSGESPADRAPVVTELRLEGSPEVTPGAVVTARATASDPDGTAIRACWVLRPDAGEYLTGGDYRPPMIDIADAVLESDPTKARVRMPRQPGPYRLFLYVYDEAGKAATANLPLLVEGRASTPMPFPVYEDGFEAMPWVPSGWMGSTYDLSLDGGWSENPHSGRAAIRIRYEGRSGWAAIAWQHPPNNWGETDGGFDLEGATALELYARGEYGGERVDFGIGLPPEGRAFPDSAFARLEGVFLTRDWKRYRISLGRKDLSSIKTGFVVTLTGRSTPVTVYLDSIRYVR